MKQGFCLGTKRRKNTGNDFFNPIIESEKTCIQSNEKRPREN